ASAASATSVNVTFSAPPKAAEATDATHYCISTTATCTAPGEVAVSAAALSGSTATLTTAAQTPSAAYTVFVTGVTRDPDGAALSTSSATFTGYLMPSFTVASAVPSSTSSLTVTYSDDYTASAAAEQASSYCIALASAADCSAQAVPVSAAAAAGARKVLLTTGAQDSNVAYRLYVTGDVRRASNNDALSANTADFRGLLIVNGSFEAQTGTAIT